jgi:DNA topoisomerase-1
MSELPTDYSLIIAEKPDAARRIAAALGGGSETPIDGLGIIARHGGDSFVIIPAAGHLFSLVPAYSRRDIYPVLDLRWAPLSVTDKRRKDVDRRISSFRSVASHASRTIVACDYDIEGDTIGYNIIKHACHIKHVKAFRAKFSTLTQEDLLASFSDLKSQEEWPLAEAGRTRHFLDFVWGVNLSRALTRSITKAGGRYVTLSIGRVQGPALNYIYERELEVRTHVPIPYWHAQAMVDAEGHELRADYAASRVQIYEEAKLIKSEVEGRQGVVIEAKRRTLIIPPPPPFNLSDLQHEAFRILHFTPMQTLSMAEGLYLRAAVSYPRTSSQQIPPSISYDDILRLLSKQEAYRPLIESKLHDRRSPSQGEKSDSAHPAIFPTGEPPVGLNSEERSLYDLIVRRFLSAFGEDSIQVRQSLLMSCGRHSFSSSVTSTTSDGWTEIYGHATDSRHTELPSLKVGDPVKFLHVDINQRYESSPPRFNQNTLLERMERDEIGTKATRADIISTLIERGYVSDESMELSALGFAVVEAMAASAPAILSIQMTKSIEEDLRRIETGELDPRLVAAASVNKLLSSLEKIDANLDDLSQILSSSNAQTAKSRLALGGCPLCHQGELVIIRSRKSGKRFVGCSNYSGGCRASAPLPQKGSVRATRTLCKTCGWPVVNIYASYGQKPWRLCVNTECASKTHSNDLKTFGGRRTN